MLVPIEYEAGPVWTFWREKKNILLCQESYPKLSSLFTILTILSCFLFGNKTKISSCIKNIILNSVLKHLKYQFVQSLMPKHCMCFKLIVTNMPINVGSATNLHNMFSHIISKYSCFSTSFSFYCSNFFSSNNCPPTSIRSCLLPPCPQSPPNGLLFTLKN